MDMRKRVIDALILLLILVGSVAWTRETQPTGRWLAGDFHNHTFLTDGAIEPGEVFRQAFRFGLDWIVNSEHGGAFGRNSEGVDWPVKTEFLGSPPKGKMWRWQSLWHTSFTLVTGARTTYADKLIGQGYEWNVPTHDHASVGIVGPDEEGGRAIARHEYLFDANDFGTTSGTLLGVNGKSADNNHEKALAGVHWLADNYPDSSYFIINHPSRELRYSIADIRDLNDAAPLVAFGLEGIPGHQKSAIRGGYKEGPFRDAMGREITARARTYGGADLMIAKVGGTWDALLGEGRRFFTFANSDFHNPNYDFWPGEYSKNRTFVQDLDHDGKYTLSEVLEGMRSGNSFVTEGDLISSLEFSARSGRERVDMGSTLEVGQGDEVEVTISFRMPSANRHGDQVSVNHIDLIAGEVHPKVGKYLHYGTSRNPAYDKETNETAKVIATFTSKEWRDDGDGWKSIVYRVTDLRQAMYFRLRGTNLGSNVPGETDRGGNPLNDDLMAPNTGEKAFADLWFYSNPLFISVNQ